MQLKTYQKETLGTLRHFFEKARIEGAKSAYEAIVSAPEMAKRLKGFASAYTSLNGLDETPYVCLRLPTGGGKTVLAAHAVNIAKEAWIERDFPLVLWLVPTTTIRKQTVDALKNPRHPYRAALDEAFAGRVRVFDIGDFTQVLPHDLRSNCCVVVATIQTLRVKDTEGRKVYAHHEMLEPHFTNIPQKMPGLEVIEEGRPGAGTIKFSFANLLLLHNPLMIVDEAHKAVTGLSREMQTRVNPTAIIEFTATPQPKSNILYSVTAQELKDEEMIKLPVVLSEHQTWQSAVTGAISKRAELTEDAKRERDYIRPIVLFQAQNKDEEVNVAVLKQHLIDVEGIEPKRIAVATGDQRDLDGINLFDPSCDIDFIITVEALKEGWDCSFAYVFCSVANIHSATDAEQLLGRVLRMPYAKRRSIEILNRAYANLTSKSFSEAAYALRDRLISMGFEESEAEDNILPEQLDLNHGLFGHVARPTPSRIIRLATNEESLKALEAVAPTKIRVTTNDQGQAAVKITGFLSVTEKEKLIAAIPVAEAPGFREQVESYEAEHMHLASPAERGETFTVPALMVWIQGELEFADTDILMEYHDWSLASHSAKLEPKDFSIQETADTFEIDIDQQRLFVKHADQSAQLLLNIPDEGWTEQNLVLFLDRQVRDKFIGQSELVRWLTDLVNYLVGPRNIPLSTLMQCKYLLARKVKERIAEIRTVERKGVYQQSLFAPEAKPEISFENGFVFKEAMFADVRTYRGSYRFSKHFTGWDQVSAFDGAEDGEELTCAKILDSLPEVKYWVRNVAKHPHAFWLPVASGKFYPDFVAKLNDGRTLIVEYKGAHLSDTADTDEKRTIGELWERQSEGQGLFLIVEKQVNGQDVRGQMQAKLR
ncbi:restriction endonuclease subunit R [Ochrobactrum sp. MYb15]|nr:restriction endonuclease subunit R [Ochrobactrum sp. MYb19]PRA61712.1 restriction endonuclease subunit R [Ochrobactrum sp. MYb18]PRA76527.1 restriction endonuclease subunit R [Brucella thiophenivorans]PRA85825.1 restriction endonuclease subunit R [Ochrobactrum sp. MYb14]PRA98534.1 restriction endonuclease subunit R [Ochrobactrum sp. MYb15]